MRDRFAQLLDTKKVPHAPAVSVERWDEAAALGICERWAQAQRRRPSTVGLARLLALNFERARPETIPAEMKDQRLLPEGASADDYYREMIATFLETAGLEDTEAVLDSFKTTGTGALHRQPVTVSTAVNGAFSVAQLAASAHMPAKTALSAVQVLMTMLTTELAFDSANVRFRNSGTEEIMPLGKADASPSAKTGPNVLQASKRLAWELHKVGHAVRKMERAKAELDEARTRLADPSATAEQRLQAQSDVEAAGQALAIAYARFCMRSQLKSDYKSAAESAKIEYEGNKRALGVSVASGALGVTTTVLGILTPVAVTAAVTAGATAGAVALAAALYVGFQLSSGPSKDGEAKAKRAIVALAKSLDLFGGNAAKQQNERAQAYRTYIAQKRATNKPEVRKRAKARLVAALDEIARRDTIENDLDPLENWSEYAKLRRSIADAGEDQATVNELEEAFAMAHSNQFKASTVSEAWKTPERMRFDSMGRLLLGSVTESIVSLHEFNAKAARTSTHESRRQTQAKAQVQAGRRANVKAALRDWLQFELAQSRMKAALAQEDPGRAHAALQSAASALTVIENAEARALFAGDARKQVDATKRAKAMVIGERERYTMTNAGATALGGLVNAFGATASLGLNIQKDVALSHGVHPPSKYGDQNDARLLSQSTAPITAPYSAAERARFQKTGMAKLASTIERKGEPVVSTLDLPAADPALLDLNDRHCDAALDTLVAQLEAKRDIPDQIAVSVGGVELASAKLNGTTGYYKWRYRQASFATKAKFKTRQMRMIADSVGISVISPIAQMVAQLPLSKTRASVDKGLAMSTGVRDRLTTLAKQPQPPETTPTQQDEAKDEATLEAQTQAQPKAQPKAQPEAQSDVQLQAQTEMISIRSEAPANEASTHGSSADRDAVIVNGIHANTAANAAADANIDADVDPQPPTAPTGAEDYLASFDAQSAALALRDIPELGASARATHPSVPAAEPERAFSARPAQAALSAQESDEPRELQRQRDMMMGAGRDETLRWFQQRGIRAADNSGHASMDCLIISLLQHATGRYDEQDEPALARRAAHYRAALARDYPEIERGDRMLYDDEPAVAALLRGINRDYGVSMNLQLIMPSSDGPVRFQASGLGEHPVGVAMFGNHFQAVHRPAERDPGLLAGASQVRASSQHTASLDRQNSSSSADSTEAVAGSRRWNLQVRFDADAKTHDGGAKPARTRADDALAHRIKVNKRAETLYEHHQLALPKDTKKKLRSGEWAFDETKATGRAILESYKAMVKHEHRVLKTDVKTRRAHLRQLAQAERSDDSSAD